MTFRKAVNIQSYNKLTNKKTARTTVAATHERTLPKNSAIGIPQYSALAWLSRPNLTQAFRFSSSRLASQSWRQGQQRSATAHHQSPHQSDQSGNQTSHQTRRSCSSQSSSQQHSFQRLITLSSLLYAFQVRVGNVWPFKKTRWPAKGFVHKEIPPRMFSAMSGSS